MIGKKNMEEAVGNKCIFIVFGLYFFFGCHKINEQRNILTDGLELSVGSVLVISNADENSLKHIVIQKEIAENGMVNAFSKEPTISIDKEIIPLEWNNFYYFKNESIKVKPITIFSEEDLVKLSKVNLK